MSVQEQAARVEHALSHANLGWAVFPIWPNTKQAIIKGWPAEATKDEETIRKWWTETPDANIGIATGRASGVVVVDVDRKNGVDGITALESLHMDTLTLTAQTPHNGLHLYYIAPPDTEDLKTMHSEKLLPGLDYQANGACVLAPGSAIDGKEYQWLDPEAPIAALPAEFLALIREKKKASYVSATEPRAGAVVSEGGRNSYLTSLAGVMRRKGINAAAIEAALRVENQEKCCPPLPESDVSVIAQSVGRYPAEAEHTTQNKFKPNLLAAELRRGNSFISSPIDEAGVGVRLLCYKDGVFKPNGADYARRAIHEMLGEDSKPDRIDSVTALIKEGTKQNAKDLNPKALDLINVENGMLDWRTGELKPHAPEYLCTVQIQAKYQPGGQSTILDKFLSEVFPPDALALAEEILGYLILPTTKHQKAFMLVGEGRNGKSTFLSLLTDFLGADNISNVSLQELVENRFTPAELQGKLANIYPDLPSSCLEQSDIFKAIVSGDTIKVERKFGHPFKLTPTARLLFSANELPRSKDLSYAYFRRWVVIPFPNKFEGAADIKDLISLLRTPEAKSALLNYAIAGLRRLEEKQEFTACASVQEAGQSYRKQCDSAYEFITSRLEQTTTHTLKKTEVYAEYKEMCVEEGIHYPASQKAFNKRLKDVLTVTEGREDGARVWQGIAWKTEATGG